jgi:glutamyl-Q tRNA(Asp) synthetase
VVISQGYVGRFAPSPTGPLHAGSLVAALASWLDAKAHQGQWLVRIEDVDTPRCILGASEIILNQLTACGLHSEGPVLYQSKRSAAYQTALDQLIAEGLAYPCGCSRKDIEAAQLLQLARHTAPVYPGTCRHGLQGKPARAWRLNVHAVQTQRHLPPITRWTDECLGPQHQNVATQIGDFVLRRADGLWAYQLAVVVDDAAQGVTHVVRGADLCDNTARQILLQNALGLPTPRYRHTPLVLAADGEKLSKQNGAQALDLSEPLRALNAAASHLGLPAQSGSVAAALAQWTAYWRTPTGEHSPTA